MAVVRESRTRSGWEGICQVHRVRQAIRFPRWNVKLIRASVTKASVCFVENYSCCRWRRWKTVDQERIRDYAAAQAGTTDVLCSCFCASGKASVHGTSKWIGRASAGMANRGPATIEHSVRLRLQAFHVVRGAKLQSSVADAPDTRAKAKTRRRNTRVDKNAERPANRWNWSHHGYMDK